MSRGRTDKRTIWSRPKWMRTKWVEDKVARVRNDTGRTDKRKNSKGPMKQGPVEKGQNGSGLSGIRPNWLRTNWEDPLTYIHVHIFCSPYWLFCLSATIMNLSCMVCLWCDSWCWFFFMPFWSNRWIAKWWAKFRSECLLLICIKHYAECIVICKTGQTLNDGRWRLSSIQKMQKSTAS